MKKNVAKYFYILFFVYLASCEKINEQKELSRLERIKEYKEFVDNYNKEKKWKKLKCGLFKSEYGDLALQTKEGTDVGAEITKYLFETFDNKPIKNIVDTATFKYLGNQFYKDKNNVYLHYAMVDGGNFQIIEDADVKTFQAIGDCYAKDKNNIYDERHYALKNMDYNTFKTTNNIGCYAKDKDGYYFWDEKIDLKGADSITLKVIEKLKKL